MKLGKLKNIIRKGVDDIKVITQIIKSKRLQYTDEAVWGTFQREKLQIQKHNITLTTTTTLNTKHLCDLFYFTY